MDSLDYAVCGYVVTAVLLWGYALWVYRHARAISRREKARSVSP